MLKPGIHIIEASQLKTEGFEKVLSPVELLKAFKEQSLGAEQVRVNGLETFLLTSDVFGFKLRQALIEAANFLYNKGTTIVFSVKRVSYGEYPTVVTPDKEIDLLPIFGSYLSYEGKGHFYAPRV